MREGNTLKIAEASERPLGGEATQRRLNRSCFVPGRLACAGACRDIDVAPPPDDVRSSTVSPAGTFRQGNSFERR